MQEITYPIALRGLGTEFPISQQPMEYARILTNRFVNINGQAENRPGLKQIESPATRTWNGNFFVSADTWFVTQAGKIMTLFEHVSANGVPEEMCIVYVVTAQRNFFFKFREDIQAWYNIAPVENDQFSDYVRTNSTSVSAPFFHTQINDKTIIVSEDYVARQYDGNQVTRLLPIIESGKLTAGTSASKIVDSAVTSWLNGTYVANNDLVYNVSKNSYGLVTSVGAANLDVTLMGSAGNGATGLGLASTTAAAISENAAGDYYKVIDLVENNIFENVIGIKDNVAIGGFLTNTSVISVTAFNFYDSPIRQADYVYNTTRNAVTRVISVSSNIRVANVSGQVAGDSFVFFKSAIPIADVCHTHYGRLYLIDARDRSKVQVSGPEDPEDFTNFTKTLQGSGIDYGANQPHGEKLIALSTFQRYLVVASDQNIYVGEGTNPIADTTADTANLSPVGLFRNGVVSQRPFANIGREMLVLSNDGARSFNVTNILAIDTDNISEPIKTEFRELIQSNRYDLSRLRVIHYPKRNWVMFKISDVIYNFNYTPTYMNGQYVRGGTWSKFTGFFAQCSEYLLKQDGSLVCSYHDVSANASYLYEFDTGNFQDDQLDIPTETETAWITTEKDNNVHGIVKDGRYIKPYFECYNDTVYNVKAIADLETMVTCDTAIISANGGDGIGSAVVGTWPVGGSAVVTQQKYPLRWRGEQVKLNITTSGSQGRETISKFILYGNSFGRK